MAAPAQDEECPEVEEWMATYADAITLLMAFFVLFFSISKVDGGKFDSVAESLNETMSSKARSSDRVELEKDLADIVEEEGAQEVIQVGKSGEGTITLELDSGAFFKPGGAELLDQAIPVLKSIYEEFASPIYQKFNISIEGHTDDDPISSFKFPSNWELSTGRASTVVRFMITEGMKKNRLKATGYGDTQPKLPNKDTDGNPITENKLANRRVVMRISRSPIFEEVKVPEFRREGLDRTVRPADSKMLN
ncbi:OmpA family protein [Gammaproteobacteria bacterium]|nr:OmpA family protein [Gammaproteobacteria bacterium]